MNKSYTSIRVWAVGFMVSLCLLLAGVAQAATMLGDVTSPSDPVVPTSANSPSANLANMAIDNATNTKYANFDKFNTGFTVTPANGGTRITGMSLRTANDCQECDPSSYEIYGANTPTGPFSLLFAGDIPSITNRYNRRFFTNATPASAIYTSYKIIFPATARSGWTNVMQVGEIELPGSVETADTWAPSLVRATATDLSTLKLEFSEPVNIDNATWEISGSIYVTSVTPVQDANPSIVLLTTDAPMTPGNTYKVTVTGVADLAATPNVAASLSATAFVSTGVSGMGISVDFGGRHYTGTHPVVVSNKTDEAGYVLRKYWNGIDNERWYGQSNPALTNATGFLLDGSGLPTTVTLRFECNGWWHDGTSPFLTPSEQMMWGFMKPESASTTRGQIGTWIFTNLPPGKYDLVTYMANDCTNAWGDMWAVDFTGGYTNYFISQNRFAPPWTEASNTNDPNNRTRGNFAILHNLNPVDTKLPIWLQYPLAGGEPWAAHSGGPGFSGMQLLPAPGLKSILGGGGYMQEIVLNFLDPLNDSVIADLANFVISGDNAITGATLSDDKKVLTLTTESQLIFNKTYYITMNNIVNEDSSATWPADAMVSFVAYYPADVSINFSGNAASGTPSRLNAGDIAGADTAARFNWNNVDGRNVIDDLYGPYFTNDWGLVSDQSNKSATVMWPLKDSEGYFSPVKVSYVADVAWGTGVGSTGPNVGDKKMMLGALQYKNGSSVSNIWIENIPSGTYRVVVYTIQTNSANGEEIITLNDSVSVQVKSQGTNEWNAGTPATFQQGTDTGTPCNYVVFEGVSPVNGAFNISVSAVGDVASVSGVQILCTDPTPIQYITVPKDTTVVEGQNFTFSCSFFGPGAKTIQWHMWDPIAEIDTTIPGANGTNYTAKATGDMDQKQFYVVVDNGNGAVNSDKVLLTVIQDLTPPTVVRVIGGQPTPDKLAIIFSEPLLSDTALNVANYSITGGTVNPGVQSLTLESNANSVAVLFTFNPPLEANTDYQIGISGIIDVSFAQNTLTTNFTFHTMGIIWTNDIIEDRWFSFNTDGKVDNMMNHPTYPNSPASITYRGSFDHPKIQDYDGARLVAHIIPPVTGTYVFQDISDDQSVVFLSTDQEPSHKVQIARENVWQSETATGQISPPVFLVKDVPYYLEGVYANGTGGSYLHVKAKKPNDTTYLPISSTNGWGIKFCISNDLTAPFITSVSASPVANQVTVNFNKPMNDSVASTAAGSFATVTNATSILNVTNMILLSNKTTVLLTLDGNLTGGTAYTVTMGGAGVNDATWNTNHMSPDPASAQIVGYTTVPANPVLKEVWIGLDLTNNSANGVTALVTNVRYPCSPDTAEYVSAFDLTQPGFIYDIPHDGGRLRTWLVPAVAGNYQFQLLADDSAEVYLSQTANPADKKQILYQNAYTTTASTSPVLNLQAGSAYYFEALYQNNTGYDFIHVKWKVPGATNYTDIPASQMAYAIVPNGVTITINSQPVSQTVEECRPATFSVAASATCGTGVPLYQWYKNATAIAGGTNATLSYVPTVSENGSAIYCQVYLPGVAPVNSDTVTLNVTADTMIPAPVSVKGDASLTNIVITFSENVDQASALAVENYNVVDSQGAALGLNLGNPGTVTLIKPNTVVLGFSGSKMVQGELYTVTMQNVWDACHMNKVPDGISRSFHAWKLMPYAATFEVYTNVTGGTVADLTGSLKYQNNRPDETYFIGSFDSREVFTADLDTIPPSHDDYGARIYAWFRAPVSGTYRFYAMGDEKMEFYISMDDNPANKGSAVLTNASIVSAFNETNYLATNKDLVAGQFYYIEGLYKETTWADFLRVGVKMTTDTLTTTNLLQPIGPEYLWTMMDPDSIPALPTTGMKAVNELTVRGFNNHIVQLTNTFTNSTIAVAEAVLDGSYAPDSPNTASLPFFAETNIINYSLNPSIRSGRIFPDVRFTGATNSFVMETKTYVHLKPGTYAFGVNSDDDFRLYAGFTSSSPVIGQSGPAGTNASMVMRFNVTQEGLYPMRLVYLQNTSTANLEWWNADCTNGVDLGINAAGAPEAFRPTDANAPTITSYPTNGLAVQCGVALNFTVTALDPEDGFVPVVCNPTNGSLYTVGEKTVTCNAVDAFGNAAAPCSFLVTCTDTNPPAFTYPTNGLYIECAGTVEFTVTATDLCDGALTPVCTPASGTAFAPGVTTVSCSATDSAANTREVQFTVTVADTNAPVFSGVPTQAILAECVGASGTTVTYTLPTATDTCDGAATVTCLPASGSTFAVGDTTVSCEAFDTHNNRRTATFTVHVTADVAPVVTDGATNRVICSTEPTVVNFDIHATDTCGTATVTCEPASGSTFNSGVTTVSCTASDSNGNTTAPFTFTVTVKSDRPSMTITQDATSITLTWTKSECYKLYTRTDLGTQSKASDLTWDAYTGTVTDNGTTCTAVITKAAEGNVFFMLK